MESIYKEYLEHLNEFERKNAPNQIYFSGDISLLLEGKRISVVGSRKASSEGLARASAIAKELVRQGVIVVSGLAEGIDTVAHQSAIRNGGKTIAVLGTPINVAFPKSNAELLEVIKRSHLAISQFAEGYPVTAKNFPIRNRTMSLISDATIIIEATENSGTRHQGWESLRLGRKVYILENIIAKNNVKWVSEMIDYGAEVITRDNYRDLIELTPNLTSMYFNEDVF